jgi:hypothetical protein
MPEVKVPAPPPRKGREAPPSREQTVSNLDKAPPQATENLNFRVSKEFKRELKGWCVAHDYSMVEMLQEAFRLMQDKYGK